MLDLHQGTWVQAWLCYWLRVSPRPPGPAPPGSLPARSAVLPPPHLSSSRWRPGLIGGPFPQCTLLQGHPGEESGELQAEGPTEEGPEVGRSLAARRDEAETARGGVVREGGDPGAR